MLALNRVLVLMSTLLLSGCLGQPIKPTLLTPEKLETYGIVFGSIEYIHDKNRLIGDTFDTYSLIVESVETGETHQFSMAETRYDEERENRRKALFLRQVSPGTYKLTQMAFKAGYYIQTFTLNSPATFEVRPREAIYLGNHLVERVGARFGVLGHPKVVVSNQLDLDLPLARKFYSSMPQDDRISISPAVPSSPITFEFVKK